MIGTSDGQAFEDELDFHLGRPIQYDDTASDKQQIKDELDPEKPTIGKLKDVEKEMEKSSLSDEEFLQNLPKRISDKTIQHDDVKRLQDMLGDIYYQRNQTKPAIVDPFGTKNSNKFQDRVPQNAPFPAVNKDFALDL